MRSWLWLERSGLAPESGRARLRQLEKGIMDKRAKRKGIMAIVGRFVTLGHYRLCVVSHLNDWSLEWSLGSVIS